MNDIALNSPSVSRRGFLAGAASLTLAIGAGGISVVANASTLATSANANAWVTIGADNMINIVFPITELGQGSSTALPMILAEELDADWDMVQIDQLHTDDRTYGNPRFGNVLYTAGSTGVYAYYETLRKAGAQTRAYLMAVVSKNWDVPASELTTEPSTILHQASGRSISYGDVVGLDASGVAIPEAESVALKDPSDFRLIGGDTPRRDIPGKSTGQEVFAFDVDVPDMLQAVVVRAPVEGETPLEVNDADTLATPGVVQTVTLPDGVAIVAETWYAARAGAGALDVTWSETSPARAYDSEEALASYQAASTDLSQEGAEWAGKGDVEAALSGAAKTVEATYLSDHAYHAQIEPMAAVANVDADGKGAEIWIGTQTQSWSMHTAKEVLGTTEDRIRMNIMPMGGSFGRRTALMQDYLRDALLTSKATGKPVKVLWSRGDDIKHGSFRPSAAQHMRGGLSEDRMVSGWHHRVASPSVIQFFNPIRWSQVAPKDVITMLGSENRFYDLPDMKAEHVVMDRVARLAPWRGIGASYTSFAAEGFMDEMAEAADMDPLAFRLSLLKNNPRGQAVVNRVAEMSGWGRETGDTALGMAFAGYGDTMAAGVAEISLNREWGEIKVVNFWAAVDAGLIISPRNSEGQIEGGIIHGVSSALKEGITIAGGEVQHENFYDYEILRNSETPEIEIDILQVDAKPSAVGEAGTPMVAPAIANAFFAMTGKRIRHMPFTPDRVLEALEA